MAYRPPETDAAVLDVAKKVVGILMESGLSYRQADNALSAAQDQLETQTRPVSAKTLPEADS